MGTEWTEISQRSISAELLATAYGLSYPNTPEKDWIRGIVLSLIGIWSHRGKIRWEDAVQYLAYIEEEQRFNENRKRELDWLRDTMRQAVL